jgi:hypothetical protein
MKLIPNYPPNNLAFDKLTIFLYRSGIKTSDRVQEPRHYRRDFTSIFIKIMEFNKRRPMKKLGPPYILAGEHFSLRDIPPQILADYSAGGGPDGVLKPLQEKVVNFVA